MFVGKPKQQMIGRLVTSKLPRQESPSRKYQANDAGMTWDLISRPEGIRGSCSAAQHLLVYWGLMGFYGDLMGFNWI